MKKLALFLFLSSLAFAQGARIGDGLPTTTTATINNQSVLVPLASAGIQICTYPANAVPCTNKATTYTSSTLISACSTATQVTLAGTSACVAAADSRGNWGAWVAQGTYDFTFTDSTGHGYGPYTISAGAGSAKRPYVDVMRDCPGVVGNGIADDFTAIQACLTANPGKIIFFPKTGAASIGSSSASTTDYYLTNTLTLSGNGQGLVGQVGTQWSGGVKLLWAAGKPGILITDNATAARIENLELRSLDAGTPGASDHGIEVRSGEFIGRNLAVSQWGGYGIYLNGQAGLGYTADLWDLEDIISSNNGSAGLYVIGSDAGVGNAHRMNLRGNGGYGLEDITTNANGQNVYESIHFTSNTSGSFHTTNGLKTFINPYCESDEPMGWGETLSLIVIGGNCNIDANHVGGADYPQIFGQPVPGLTTFPGAQTYLTVWSLKDAAQYVELVGGRTANYDFWINWRDKDANSKWRIGRDAATNKWHLYNVGTATDAMTVDPTTNVTTLVGISTGSAGSANHGVCWKTATTIGYCSDAVGAGGTCTCN